MDLINLLKQHAGEFSWLFKHPLILNNGHPIYLGNKIGQLSDTKDQENFILSEVRKNQKLFAYGGYLENREFYLNTDLFSTNPKRTIHLGMDIWCAPGTPVYLPYDAHIHSFKDNDHNGDYGPTIITRQTIQKQSFFFLFGHLTRNRIVNLSVGTKLLKGNKLAELGDYSENGNWPPHLHFQIIKDIGNYEGDYPGVASNHDLEYYSANCPDPKTIFNY